MNRSISRLKAVLCCALLSAVSVIARPSNEVERFYPSGPDFKKQVGYLLMPCQGGKIMHGKQTRWRAQTAATCQEKKPSQKPQTECMVCEKDFTNCIRITCPPTWAIDQKYQPRP